MKNMKVASAYSKALFNSGTIPLEDLERVMEIWKKLPLFRTFLLSHAVSNEDKLAILELILGKKIKLFSELLNQGRMQNLPEIVEEYRSRIYESQKTLGVEIRTNTPIDSGTLQKLQEKLEGLYNQKIKITEVKDPHILAGAILRVGNKRIDYSLNGRLEKLRKELCQ